MKKNGLVIIMFVASFNLLAQRAAGPSGEMQIERMKKELSLTAEQITALEKINESAHQERLQVQLDSTLNREKRFSERRRITQARADEIKKVLTSEQLSKWTSLQKERGVQRNRKTAARDDDKMDDMKAALGITDDQVKKIATINSQMSGALKKVQSDTAVTRQNRMETVKKIIANRNAKIKKVLTDDQYEKFVAYEMAMARSRQRNSRKPR